MFFEEVLAAWGKNIPLGRVGRPEDVAQAILFLADEASWDEEVQGLARAGYRQVTLLGQNVNAYGKRFPDGSGYQGPGLRRRLLAQDAEAAAIGEAPRLVDFPALLRQIDARTAIDRVKFTTSHPFDAHDELFHAMAECRSVCEFLHLPVQSGSNRVLKAMRRGYTVEA